MRTIRTDNWDILGGERIRRWPSPEPRQIQWNISSWKGISLGARHFTVKVQEEDNAYWSEQENAWVYIYSDATARGYSFEADVMTKEEAERLKKYFVRFIKQANPDQAYEVEKMW